jgi:glycosyltransferase involved in cell wall biosynthesis
MLKVSVVIPTYNHARFLEQAIESVLAQTFPAHEVIVVDDGSTDSTPGVLARYENRIRVVRQQNQGVAAARNHGARLSTGELLAFLDADDVWLPGKLEQQTARFMGEPELGLVHCGYVEINAQGEQFDRHLNGLEGWVATEMLLFRRAVILGGGSGVLIRRDAFEQTGGFDERLSTSADWDLYVRIAQEWKVGFVPEALLQYRVHDSNMSGNIRAMERDMLLAFDKAFESASPGIRRLRRRCYGNLHSVLAGSFHSARQHRKFLSHAFKSLLFAPTNLLRYAEYPIRRWRFHKEKELALPAAVKRSRDSMT